MDAALHIDIYSIVLGNISLYSVIFLGFPMLVKKLKDAKLRKEMEIIIVWYSDTLAAGDWIVWPILLTAIYPFYSLIYLLVKKKLWLLIRTFLTDRQLVRITAAIFILWLATTLFALLHLFFAYVIAFALGLGLYVRQRRKERGA